MFTIRQKVFFRTGLVAILIFLIVRIGGLDSAAALVWGLVLGLGAFFVQRQMLITGTGYDLLRDRDEPPEQRVPALAADDAPGNSGPALPVRASTQPTGKDQVSGMPNQPVDDLKLIKGIGPKLEEELQRLGYHRFEQIANLTETQIEAIEADVPMAKGRAERDNWVKQAASLTTSRSATNR